MLHVLHAQVAELGQDELLSEYRALQELALANYNRLGSASADDTHPGDQKGKGNIDMEMEEYLLEQVGLVGTGFLHRVRTLRVTRVIGGGGVAALSERDANGIRWRGQDQMGPKGL